MDDNTDNKTPNLISEKQWLTHFETLHSKHSVDTAQHNILVMLNTEEKLKNNYSDLDQPISEQEIKHAVKKLKNNKSAYLDRIINEMIKCSINILLQAYLKLFNLILKTGIFPKQWCEGLITPIFESDDKLNCNNYRGIYSITVLQKIYIVIQNVLLNSHNTLKTGV